jgi:hypothetical protein
MEDHREVGSSNLRAGSKRECSLYLSTLSMPGDGSNSPTQHVRTGFHHSMHARRSLGQACRVRTICCVPEPPADTNERYRPRRWAFDHYHSEQLAARTLSKDLVSGCGEKTSRGHVVNFVKVGAYRCLPDSLRKIGRLSAVPAVTH